MNPRDKVEDTTGTSHVEAEKPPAYDCSVCGRSFSFLSSLSQHMRMHTGSRPYKCPYCPHRASQKGNLKVHIRSHKLDTLISDSLEEKELGEEIRERGTSSKKTSSACNEVKKGVGEDVGRVLGRSLKREKRGLARTLCCRLCGYETQREDQLLSHIEKVHIVAELDEGGSLPEVDAEGEGEVFSQTQAPDHSCNVCGRSFSQPWFLKSHMRTHGRGRAASRARAKTQLPPLTINDVPQYPESSSTPTASSGFLYELCSECGHVFHSSESLKVHIQVHTQVHTLSEDKQGDFSLTEDDQCSPAAKRRFVDYLCLRPVGGDEEVNDESSRLGRRVAELDPVCSVQAWQLATKGRVNISDTSDVLATVDRGNSPLLTPSEEKRPWRRSSVGVAGNTIAPGEESPEHLSDTEYLPSPRAGRRSSNSKSSECFECGKVFQRRGQLASHLRTHHRGSRSSGRDIGSPAESSTRPPAGGATKSRETTEQPAKEEKTYKCSQCDYITSASPDFLSHVHHIHLYPAVSQSAPIIDLQPAGGVEEPALDLCMRSDGPRGCVTPGAVAGELSRHQCSYCSHATCWPEVLWMHQSVTHKISSGSVAPCWAPKKTTRVPKQGLLPVRRTGHPPALEGKECPPLNTVIRSHRTRPPAGGQSRGHNQSPSGQQRVGSGWPRGSGRTRAGEEVDRWGKWRGRSEILAKLGSAGSAEKRSMCAAVQNGELHESRMPVYVQSRQVYHIPMYSAGYGGAASRPQEGVLGASLASVRRGVRTCNPPVNVFSVRKNCKSYESAALYRPWKTDNQQLPHAVGITPQQRGLTANHVENISSNPTTFART